jgi:hypothetical protein
MVYWPYINEYIIYIHPKTKYAAVYIYHGNCHKRAGTPFTLYISHYQNTINLVHIPFYALYLSIRQYYSKFPVKHSLQPITVCSC